MSKNQEDVGNLLGKIYNTATVNGPLNMSIEDTSQKELFLSKFLSALREKWFSSHEFSANI